ncbi:MAG: phosphatidylserine decarboxylase family protein [Bacteroidales bacterium]|nr:phosphatidylserine decarboxylase family protein [Bacteroidales bacterium]
MKIHREGIRIILQLTAAVLLIFLLVNIFFPHQTVFHLLLYITGLLFIASVCYFFRKPARKGSEDPGTVLSAADGKVVNITQVIEDEYFKDHRLIISVFMSILDIHVNLFPVKGTVIYAQYHPGRFFLAYHPKSSLLNEHHSIVVQTLSGHQILLRQIAGGLARRIVSPVKPGTQVEKGQEIGIIKFGSRLDMFLPLDCTVNVQVGQHVRCGETVVAILPHESQDGAETGK